VYASASLRFSDLQHGCKCLALNTCIVAKMPTVYGEQYTHCQSYLVMNYSPSACSEVVYAPPDSTHPHPDLALSRSPHTAHINVRRFENKNAELSQRNRAMPPMYGCPENFRESLTTPTATFLEIFNGLLFRLSLVYYLRNGKSYGFQIWPVNSEGPYNKSP